MQKSRRCGGLPAVRYQVLRYNKREKSTELNTCLCRIATLRLCRPRNALKVENEREVMLSGDFRKQQPYSRIIPTMEPSRSDRGRDNVKLRSV